VNKTKELCGVGARAAAKLDAMAKKKAKDSKQSKEQRVQESMEDSAAGVPPVNRLASTDSHCVAFVEQNALRRLLHACHIHFLSHKAMFCACYSLSGWRTSCRLCMAGIAPCRP
jgi:hypothetical protein